MIYKFNLHLSWLKKIKLIIKNDNSFFDTNRNDLKFKQYVDNHFFDVIG